MANLAHNRSSCKSQNMHVFQGVYSHPAGGLPIGSPVIGRVHTVSKGCRWGALQDWECQWLASFTIDGDAFSESNHPSQAPTHHLSARICAQRSFTPHLQEEMQADMGRRSDLMYNCCIREY